MTQKSPGRMAMKQEGSRVAIDSTAAAVDKDVGVPGSEMKRFSGRVNQNGPSQTPRSLSWADTNTLPGELSPVARRAARRKNPIVIATESGACRGIDVRNRSERLLPATMMQQRFTALDGCAVALNSARADKIALLNRRAKPRVSAIRTESQG